MKVLRLTISVLVIALLIGCKSPPPGSNNADSITITLECNQESVHSIDELKCQVYLLNKGESSLLIHTRLFYLPFPAPSFAAELLISISNTSGTYVQTNWYSNYDYPSQDTLGVLKATEQIAKVIYPGNWFDDSAFIKGEKYTIVAIYQNELEVTQTIAGVEVSSWVGSIQSNEVTFTILP